AARASASPKPGRRWKGIPRRIRSRDDRTPRAPTVPCRAGDSMTDPDFLPFCRPTLGEEEIASVVESLRSGWIPTGPKVLAFEKMFRDRLGVPQAVALNSATAGLHVALAALGIGPGDEVITTSMTWPSTMNMVELLGG